MSIINCPNCKSALRLSTQQLKCEKGHCFDFAKEGYVNLLLPNKKKKSDPGDSKLMINAREAFLSTGHYDFLITAMESAINSLPPFSGRTTECPYLLDLGCGSGYYTRRIFEDASLHKIGVDISKAGVSKAAKKDKDSTYIVGSVFDLPIKDNAVDLIINIFAPSSISEVKRVLQVGGHFLKIVPGKDHMKEIASLVYETFIPHQSTIATELSADAALEDFKVEKVEKKITLREEHLHNLISMTPYFYKFKKRELEELKELSVTISFEVIVVRNVGEC